MTNSKLEPTKGADKLWLWLMLGGCGGMLLLIGLIVTGLVGGAIWFFMREFNVSFDPRQAQATAQSIMTYELPGEVIGLASSPDLLGAEVALVQSVEGDTAAALWVGRVPPEAKGQWGVEPEDFWQILEQEEILTITEITVQSTVKEARSLCGETATVRLSQGTEELTGKAATTYEAIVEKNSTLYLASVTTTGADSAGVAAEIFASLDCR